MIDSYRNKGQRARLVQDIKNKGITDSRVLEAINKLPRHFFLDRGYEELAYVDKPFAIGSGQTISQPYTVAFQTELLNVKKGDKILEVGTGSGYQTAILLELGAKVYTIERIKKLHLEARYLLGQLGYRPRFFYGDGYKGKATYGPFDKILVTAGAPYIPKELQMQLKIGGILVVPVGSTESQTMYKIERISETEFQQTDCGRFVFVPMLQGLE